MTTMIVKRIVCDRCGYDTEYTEGEIFDGWLKLHGYVHDVSSNTHPKKHDLDLCPECAMGFREYLEDGQKTKQYVEEMATRNLIPVRR